MADNRCSAYSFYVPLGDKSLNDFVEAQSNLSMTIRLLIKGFIYNCGGEYPDVSLMDLKDLIANASIDPERLAELAAQEKPRGRDRQKAAGIDRGDKADIVAEPGTPEVIDLDDEEDEDGESKEPEDAIEDGPTEDAESVSAVAEPAEEEEISIGDDEDEDEAGEEAAEPESVSEPEQELQSEPEPEHEPEPKSEPKPVEPEPKPATKPAPKSAAAPLSGRAAYNQAQDEEEVGDIDDIMSLMGGM